MSPTAIPRIVLTMMSVLRDPKNAVQRSFGTHCIAPRGRTQIICRPNCNRCRLLSLKRPSTWRRSVGVSGKIRIDHYPVNIVTIREVVRKSSRNDATILYSNRCKNTFAIFRGNTSLRNRAIHGSAKLLGFAPKLRLSRRYSTRFEIRVQAA